MRRSLECATGILEPKKTTMRWILRGSAQAPREGWVVFLSPYSHSAHIQFPVFFIPEKNEHPNNSEWLDKYL
jgi:hypothetical protein